MLVFDLELGFDWRAVGHTSFANSFCAKIYFGNCMSYKFCHSIWKVKDSQSRFLLPVCIWSKSYLKSGKKEECRAKIWFKIFRSHGFWFWFWHGFNIWFEAEIQFERKKLTEFCYLIWEFQVIQVLLFDLDLRFDLEIADQKVFGFCFKIQFERCRLHNFCYLIWKLRFNLKTEIQFGNWDLI